MSKEFKVLPKKYRLKVYIKALELYTNYVDGVYCYSYDKPNVNFKCNGLCSMLRRSISKLNIPFKYKLNDSYLDQYPELTNKNVNFINCTYYWDITYQDRINLLKDAIKTLKS